MLKHVSGLLELLNLKQNYTCFSTNKHFEVLLTFFVCLFQLVFSNF